MRYFIDTEFIDTGREIDLVSIGIVCEDGREYYAQSVEFDHRKASVWVKENMLTHLLTCPSSHASVLGISGLYRTDRAEHQRYGQCVDRQRGLVHNCPWRTREQMKHDVSVFFNPSDGFELWGWCAGYDWVAFCQLFGTMMDLPRGWPHYIHDLQHVLDERSIFDEELPPQEGGQHNALADARHIKKLWGYLVRNDAWQ